MSIVNVLHSKDAMNSNYNITHGGMYSAHYFVISILKTIFSQISIDSQLLVKILKRYRTRKKHFKAIDLKKKNIFGFSMSF